MPHLVSLRPHALALTLALALVTGLAAAPAVAQPPAGPAPAALADRAAATADTLAAAPAAASVDRVAEVRAGFTPENRRYASARATLTIVEPLYGLLIGLLVLFTGLSARLRDVASAFGRRRYVQVLAYLVLYSAVAFVLGFPLAWYSGFALEHQYRLSDQHFGPWLGEQLIGVGVGILFFGVVPLAALAYRAFEGSPRRWWLWLSAATLPVMLAAVFLSPYIDMLTNRFTPLRDATLKTEIVSLAQHAGIPGRDVFQVDKSRQTRKYNAYVNGFGASQRIVLWDTTLKGMSRDEILFVMGHEMGHYVLRHMWKGVLIFTLFAFVLFAIAHRLLAVSVGRWGPRWGFTSLHDVASLPLVLVVLTILSVVAQPAINGVSRAMEHEADIFGLEVTHTNDAAARAFIKLGSQNRSDPEPPAWRVWMFYSHPPLIERVRFALEYRPWEQGQPGRLFHGRPYVPASPTAP